MTSETAACRVAGDRSVTQQAYRRSRRRGMGFPAVSRVDTVPSRGGSMSTKRHPQVVNIDEIAQREQGRGGFANRARRLGAEAGNRALGCSHFEIPPGKTAFPFHFHSAIEEAIYVLEGTGKLR